MSNFERTTSWQQIQQGVKEAERPDRQQRLQSCYGEGQTDVGVYGSVSG